MQLKCQKCGGSVSFDSPQCPTCGAPIAKSGDSIPFIHFGFGNQPSTVENVEARDLGGGRIQLGNQVFEPVDISTLPSMEDSSKWMELHDKGCEHVQKEEFEQALETLNKALEVLPNAWFTLLVKGQVLINLNRPEEVLPITENLIKRQVAVLEALHLRAAAMIEMDNPEMGLTIYNMVLNLKPDYEPALKARRHLLETHPNNIKYVMKYIREPARKAYKFLHDLLSKIESFEHISFEIRDLMLESLPSVKPLELEFEQTQFRENLHKIMHSILLNKGYFLIYVGKIKAEKKRLLMFGNLRELYPRDYLVSFKVVEEDEDIPPYHEFIWDHFEDLEKQWKDIWENSMCHFPLYMFFNHQILIDYLLELKKEFRGS